MYLLRIAVRNLFRRRRRTLIIAGVLALAIFFGLYMDSIMGGMLEVSFSNIIDFETAHVELGREEFMAEEEEFPLDELFVPSEDLTAEVQDMSGYQAMTPVIDFSASAITGREEFPVRVRAIDSKNYDQVFRTRDYVVEGEFIESGETGLVIGSDLADLLELEVGDFYTLRLRDRRDSFNTMQGEVKGIVNTPHPDINLSTVFVDRDYAVETLGIEAEEISKLMIRMENRTEAVASAASLQDNLADTGLAVYSWEDASEMLLAMQEFAELEILFIMILIVIVGAIGIINLVVLSAIERVEEIGMMKAMGLKESEIVKVFLLEAGGVGVLGGIIGSVLGAIGIGLLSRIGLDLYLIYGDVIVDMGFPIMGKMYGTWNLPLFAFFFIFAVVTAVVASIIPSYWAARKNPVDAIYHR